MPTSCQNSLGHEDCGFHTVELEAEGHKSSPNAFERSRNKVYKRKIERQKGLVAGPVISGFKKGKK